MSEVSLWDTLRGLLPRGQYSRIESGDTAPGFPDVHYQLRGPDVAGTIELKDSKHKIGVPFRDREEGVHLSQIIWINQNVANGGINWITARVNQGLFWIPGKYVELINGREDLGEISTWVVHLQKVKPHDVKNINFMLRGMFL